MAEQGCLGESKGSGLQANRRRVTAKKGKRTRGKENPGMGPEKGWEKGIDMKDI